jgi:hypothetical protein
MTCRRNSGSKFRLPQRPYGRWGCRSRERLGFEPHEAGDRQRVTLRAEARHHPSGHGRQPRMMAKRLTTVNVRDMELDDRHVRAFDRVVQGDGRMRVRAGVEEHAYGLARGVVAACLVNPIDELPSWLDCRQSIKTPSLAPSCRHSDSISARVSWPYTAGSRVPSKLRLGPFNTRTFFTLPHRRLLLARGPRRSGR